MPLGKLVASLRNGLSPSTKGDVPGEVLTLSAVTQGRYDEAYCKAATFDRPPADDQIARPGMLLICRGNGNINLVGAGVIVPDGARNVVFPDTVIGAQLDSDAIDAHYLRHAWASRAIRTQVEASARTTNGTHKVNQKSLGAIDVPVPPLDEQRRIAAILDKADAIRRKRREAIAMTEDLLQTAFVHTVGNKHPDHPRWPATSIAKLAVQKKGAIRSGPFGSALKHSEFVDEGIAVLGIDNAVQNRFAWDERRFITPKKYEKLRRYKVFPGDVIITIMGTTGRSAVVPDDIPEAITTKHLATITVDPAKARSEYVAHALHRDDRLLHQVAMRNRGAIMAGLNLGIIRELEVRLPPLRAQDAWVEQLARIEAMRTRLERAAAEADDLFHSLVQRAFAGHLGGSDAS